MAQLLLILNTNQGQEEIALLESGSATLGREPENTVVIDTAAISRRHICFFSAGNNWLIRDLESTNGSWLNGVKLNPLETRLLRDGDELKLADLSLLVRISDASAEPGLIVFENDSFQGEVYLPDQQSVFQLGGEEGQFQLEGDLAIEVQLKVYRDVSGMVISVQQDKVRVLVNGVAALGEVNLSDRDEVTVDKFSLIVSDPLAITRGSYGGKVTGGIDRSQVKTSRSTRIEELGERWESEAGRRKVTSSRRFVFAENKDDALQTVRVSSVDSSTKAKFDMNISQRYSTLGLDEGDAPDRSFSRIMIVLGAVLFLILAAIVSFLIAQFLA